MALPTPETQWKKRPRAQWGGLPAALLGPHCALTLRCRPCPRPAGRHAGEDGSPGMGDGGARPGPRRATGRQRARFTICALVEAGDLAGGDWALRPAQGYSDFLGRETEWLRESVRVHQISQLTSCLQMGFWGRCQRPPWELWYCVCRPDGNSSVSPATASLLYSRGKTGIRPSQVPTHSAICSHHTGHTADFSSLRKNK